MKPVIPQGLPEGFIVCRGRGCEELVRGLPAIDMASLHGAPMEFIRASGIGSSEPVPDAGAPVPRSPARPSRRPRRRG
jgi:hypothetical protein